MMKEDIKKLGINRRDSARYVRTLQSHNSFRTEKRIYHKHRQLCRNETGRIFKSDVFEKLPIKKTDAQGNFFEEANRPIEQGLQTRYRCIHQDNR